MKGSLHKAPTLVSLSRGHCQGKAHRCIAGSMRLTAVCRPPRLMKALQHVVHWAAANPVSLIIAQSSEPGFSGGTIIIPLCTLSYDLVLPFVLSLIDKSVTNIKSCIFKYRTIWIRITLWLLKFSSDPNSNCSLQWDVDEVQSFFFFRL